MFREMRYVYEVYRHQSFSKAAAALYVSQPSLSLMVKKAEEKLGSPIFDRSTSPIRLTETGQEYIRAAMQIMEIESNFGQYLSDAEECLTGSLALGGTTLFTSYVLPPLISAFSTRYPGVDIRLHEFHTNLLKKELQEGNLDFVVENSDFDPAVYERQTFLHEELVLTVPAGLTVNERAARFRLTAREAADSERLSRADAVPLELFRNEDFLLLKDGNDTRIRADKLCAQAGFHPRTRLLLDQQITAYNLSSYGLGISFTSSTLIQHVAPDASLCFYRLDSALSRRDIGIFYKRNRFITSPMREFLHML